MLGGPKNGIVCSSSNRNYLDNVTFCHCEPSEAAKQSQRRHEGIASVQKARLAMTDTQSNIVELLTLPQVEPVFWCKSASRWLGSAPFNRGAFQIEIILSISSA
jgi:hypothetical protein